MDPQKRVPTRFGGRTTCGRMVHLWLWAICEGRGMLCRWGRSVEHRRRSGLNKPVKDSYTSRSMTDWRGGMQGCVKTCRLPRLARTNEGRDAFADAFVVRLRDGVREVRDARRDGREEEAHNQRR